MHLNKNFIYKKFIILNSENKNIYFYYNLYKIVSIHIRKKLKDQEIWKWPLVKTKYNLNIYTRFM